MDTFLSKIAKELIIQFGNSFTDVTVILPNRRSKVFLINEIEKNISETTLAPSICSIQDFIEKISNIRPIDTIEQLFEFYKVYTEVAEKSERQSFEQFAPWAKVLLKDFDEIDTYLLEPNKILKYLKDIKDIEHWSLSEKRTEIIEKHLKFWELLPKFYSNFYQYLIHKKTGYQGLIFREATHKISDFSKNNRNQFFVFAGFNALTPSEEKIIQYLLKENQAKIYWDIDRTFFENFRNQAGHYIRNIKNNWKYYNSNSFEWIFDEFSKSKNIKIIGTQKSIGQSKVVGKIIEEQLEQNPKNLDNTAVILSEKNLLIPLLYSLPDKVDNLNITLGYSAKNNPVQFLINRLFKMHSYAKSKKGNDYVFYYKDVLEILSHPFVEPYLHSEKTTEIIKHHNFTFITLQKLYEIQQNPSGFFKLIFSKWSDNPLEILDIIFEVLMHIKNNLNQNSDSEKVTKTFVFEIFKIINRLRNYFSITPNTWNIQSLYGVYKQIIDSAEISFEGEPLSGLQIMGILESRTLDFENVIFTSVNEGKIPFGKSLNSFIPYDVKREFGLPTYRDRDAIYTYHFYRLLQRAKNIYLIYNTEDEGIDAGEKSRFITQLKIEKQPNHTFTEEIYNAVLPTISVSEIVVEKSEKVMGILKAISEKGFSPSSLSVYIRNPIEFYHQRILKINEKKEVEETIEANTLGNIIHSTLENLYKPYINKYLSISDIEDMENQLSSILLQNFHKEFKEGDVKRGKNLLAFESAKRSVYNFLKAEKQAVLDGDSVKILFLEQKFERILEDDRLPFPIKISGFIDRIEQRNGVIRIIDYKTGKVEKLNLTLTDWNDFLSEPKKNKIIQLLCYVFMFEEQAGNFPIETGIISFKNLKSGFLPFSFAYGKADIEQHINPEIIKNFKEQTISLLLEIFNKNIPFTDAEKTSN